MGCTHISGQLSDPVRFTVSHVQLSTASDKDSVRSRKRTLQRIGLRAITPLPSSKHRSNDSPLTINRPYHVILRVRYIEGVPPPRQSLRTSEPGTSSISPIACVPLLTGSREVVNSSRPAVDTMDRISFAKRDIQIPLRIESHGSRSVQRNSRNRRAIGSRPSLSGAGIRLDYSRSEIHTTDSMIADITNQQRLLHSGRPRRCEAVATVLAMKNLHLPSSPKCRYLRLWR